jgi:hypothetical protein
MFRMTSAHSMIATVCSAARSALANGRVGSFIGVLSTVLVFAGLTTGVLLLLALAALVGIVLPFVVRILRHSHIPYRTREHGANTIVAMERPDVCIVRSDTPLCSVVSRCGALCGASSMSGEHSCSQSQSESDNRSDNDQQPEKLRVRIEALFV